jgi:hypothetical protein
MRDLLQEEQLARSVTDEAGRGGEIVSWAFSCLFAESLEFLTWSVAGLKVYLGQEECKIEGRNKRNPRLNPLSYERLSTIVTLVWFLSSMYFLMSPTVLKA